MDKNNTDGIHFAFAEATYEDLTQQPNKFTRDSDIKLGNKTLTAKMAYTLSEIECNSINFYCLKTIEVLPARLLAQAKAKKITFRFKTLHHKEDLAKIASWSIRRQCEGLPTPKIEWFDAYYDHVKPVLWPPNTFRKSKIGTFNEGKDFPHRFKHD